MAPKLELEKLVWQWVESTLPENVTQMNVETAYRLHLKRCRFNSCRRNCKGNPHCLEALGERNWLGELDDSSWNETDDPLFEKREPGMFSGLKNLGATCYVNSLLQLWFHNTAFREAIYQYKPSLEHTSNNIHDEASDEQFENGEIFDYFPKSVIGQLQIVFALLQFSNKKYVDPSAFIKSLGLNTAEQQDAQEFSKLFISLLENKLQTQSNAKVRNVVQGQFRGEYAYVTKCSKCQRESTCPSNFYELDLNIKGNKDLNECIIEFLKEESLEGNDQYHCGTCQSKQNATRKIQLRHLPPVLNLQLLRFIYDRNSSQKKKLNSNIRFPEILDMSEFIVENGIDTCLYDLTAVLIHHGSSAYSGHYVAIIKDRISGTWFRFNDENIEKIDGKHLNLGIEEDTENGTPKPTQRSRLPKGIHSSSNAYMLVYQKQDKNASIAPIDSSVEWDIPEKLQEVISKDNSRFDEWVMEMEQMREYNTKSNKERQDEIRTIYPELITEENEEWEWISTEWLSKWLSEATVVPTIENIQPTCPHHMLPVDRVIEVKCVRKKAADALYEKYGGGPRLGKESLCRRCVVSHCHYLRNKALIQEDSKFITTTCRSKIPECEQTYWIGKESLRYWKKLALHQLASECRLLINDNTGGQPTNDNNASECEPADDVLNETAIRNLNEDIKCIHGGLAFKDSIRRKVSETVWQKLKRYFPSAIEFFGNVDPCLVCMRLYNDPMPVKDVNRTLAAEQKQFLEDLYFDRNRPSVLQGDKPILCFVINKPFVEMWRLFVKEPTKYQPVIELANAVLLCKHDKLLYHPEINGTKISANDVVLIWEEEWKHIRKLFNFDHEIRVEFRPLPEKTDKDSFTAIYQPEICSSCNAEKLQEEQQQLFTYTDAYVYVSRIPTGACDSTVSNENCNINETGDDATADKEDNDPEFVQGSTGCKKRKLCDRSPTLTNSNSVIDVSSVPQVRRSTRNRKCRDDKRFCVSSNHKLKDLKRQIMQEFEVPTFDQHLILNGKVLEGNQATLAELKVMAGNTIYLKVDEPSEQAIITEKVSAPEEGFKGTELVGS